MFIASWFLLLGFGSACYGHRHWGSGAGTNFGLGAILLFVLIANVQGALRQEELMARRHDLTR
jgi:hypothetical protein